MGSGRLVRFNVDNTLHVYPADPNVKLSSKRAKIPRRFDGPEWSIYKALRRHKRSLSESSSRSVSSDGSDGTKECDMEFDTGCADTSLQKTENHVYTQPNVGSVAGTVRLDKRLSCCPPSPPPDGPVVTITDVDDCDDAMTVDGELADSGAAPKSVVSSETQTDTLWTQTDAQDAKSWSTASLGLVALGMAMAFANVSNAINFVVSGDSPLTKSADR